MLLESGTPSNPDKLHTPGPFNPTASLPQRVVRRILDLEFLEMSEKSYFWCKKIRMEFLSPISPVHGMINFFVYIYVCM